MTGGAPGSKRWESAFSPAPTLPSEGPGGPLALLSFLHIALQGSPFWKVPQEMHKAVRTADLQPISLCRHCIEETRGVGQKTALETNEHLRNPVGLVVRARAQDPHSPHTYSAYLHRLTAKP